MSAHARPGGFDTRVQSALADPLLKLAIDRTTGTARTNAPRRWPRGPGLRRGAI